MVSFITRLIAVSTKGNWFPVLPTWLSNWEFLSNHLWNGSPYAIGPLSCVCNVGALYPNGCIYQDATWYRGRPQPTPTSHCVRWRPSSPSPKKGHSSPTFQLLAHVGCDQRAGWIKMPLGMEVGLGPGHIVLDGGPLTPSPKGHTPQFSAHVSCGQSAGSIKMPLGREVDLGPGDSVRWGSSSAPPKGAQPPNFRPMSVVAKRLDGLRYHLIWR